jgi:hypothetical protein
LPITPSTTNKVYPAKPEEKSKLALKNLDVVWMCRDTSDAILKWMQEVTFEVETITPLFLVGADQATAESYTFLPFVFGSSNYALPSLSLTRSS